MATKDFRAAAASTNPVNAKYRLNELMQGDQYSADKFVLKTVTVNTATTNVAQNDVMQFFTIPAGAYILALAFNVTTAEGATATMKVGPAVALSADDDAFGAAINLNSAVMSCAMPGALAEADPNTYAPTASQGLFCPAADIIQGIANHALDAAIFEVSVLYVEMFD